MATTYQCWADPDHDLTEAVGRRRRNDRPTTVFRLQSGQASDELAREVADHYGHSVAVLSDDDAFASTVEDLLSAVPHHGDASDPAASDDSVFVVTCPYGHGIQNAFGPGLSDLEARGQHAHVVVVGRPLSPRENALTEAAKELSPEKSLNRASESAKWVISSISIVAVVVGGFGIVTGVADSVDRFPVLVAATIGLAAVALAAAIAALIPRVQDVDLGDLESLDQHYKALIRWRGYWTLAATIALLLAVLFGVGLAVATAYADDKPTAELTTTWDGSGLAAVLTVDAAVSGAEPDSTIEATVVQDGSDTPLASATSTTGADGTATVSFKFRPADTAEPFTLRLADADTVLGEVTLSAPAFTPPPTTAPAATE